MDLGVKMMLKNLGIDPALFDPEKIKLALTTARDEIMAQVAQINLKLDSIEAKLNKVLYPVADNEQDAVEGGSLDSPHDKVN